MSIDVFRCSVLGGVEFRILTDNKNKPFHHSAELKIG